MKILNIFVLTLLVFFFSACSSLNNNTVNTQENTKKKGIKTNIQVSKDSKYFKDSTLVLSLYEYDPFLADVSATLIERKSYVANFIKDNKSSFPISINLGQKKTFKKNRKYYIVARVYDKDGKQTHHGYKNGTDGFIKVLENQDEIMIILKYKI